MPEPDDNFDSAAVFKQILDRLGQLEAGAHTHTANVGENTPHPGNGGDNQHDHDGQDGQHGDGVITGNNDEPQNGRLTLTDEEIDEAYEIVHKIVERLVNDKTIVGPILMALAENDAVWERAEHAMAEALRSVTIVIPTPLPKPAADPQPRQDALNEIDALQRWAKLRKNNSVVAKLTSWQQAVTSTTPETFDPEEHLRQLEAIRDELRDADRSRPGVR
jgi:hypothetical protein